MPVMGTGWVMPDRDALGGSAPEKPLHQRSLPPLAPSASGAPARLQSASETLRSSPLDVSPSALHALAPEEELPLVIALMGPTASGKTDLAIQLAETLDLAVLSIDSRQIYRGMDIGTAKPSTQQRLRVRHELLDLCSPDQPITLQDFTAAARQAIEAEHRRRGIALLAGGTGLYLKALLEEIWKTQGHFDLSFLRDLSDEEVRAYLRECGLAWREDSSNASLQFARNRIRRELLPQLEREWNPRLTEALGWVNAGFAGEPQDVRSWPVLLPLAEHADTVAATADAAEIADRESLCELLPRQARVDRLVDAAARSAAVVPPRRPLTLIHRGEEDLGVLRIDHEVGGAGFGINRITVDDSLSQLFRSNTPEFKQYEEVTKRFPSTEYDVLVVVEGKADGPGRLKASSVIIKHENAFYDASPTGTPPAMGR